MLYLNHKDWFLLLLLNEIVSEHKKMISIEIKHKLVK